MCSLSNLHSTHKGVLVVVPELDGAILAGGGHVPAVVAVDAGGGHHAATPLTLGFHDALVPERSAEVPDPHRSATQLSFQYTTWITQTAENRASAALRELMPLIRHVTVITLANFSNRCDIYKMSKVMETSQIITVTGQIHGRPYYY